MGDSGQGQQNEQDAETQYKSIIFEEIAKNIHSSRTP
jgi:hypothetical protein